MLKKSRVMYICILTGIYLFSGATMLSACESTPIAKTGDNVQVNYTLSLADGTVYETSVGNQPLELIIGKGDFLPDFEKAIVGMKVGESKTIIILAADAYGTRRDDLVFTVDRSQLAAGVEPKVGDQLQNTDASGQPMVAIVTAVSDTTITLDTNLPLAGEDLTFKIDLLKIN
ncbi:peptidylprolyl isomerase [Chloroflexota bacterium]